MKLTALIFSLAMLFLSSQGFCQFNVLKKVQNKVERKVDQKIDEKTDEAIDDVFDGDNDSNTGGNQYPDNSGNYPDNDGNRPGSNRGAVKMSAPDVAANISDAKSSFDTKNYSDTRFAIQQALRGIEFELGKDVLESMPTSVKGMNYDESKDEVYSSGIGFVGLSIKREYAGGDKEVSASIMNNSAILGSYNMILSNPSYYSGSEDNYQVTKINSYRAVVESEENGAFNVGIPFGQSSVFVLNLYNFDTYEEVISVAENFNVDEFKRILGEQ